jgi:hypothetical protein
MAAKRKATSKRKSRAKTKAPKSDSPAELAARGAGPPIGDNVRMKINAKPGSTCGVPVGDRIVHLKLSKHGTVDAPPECVKVLTETLGGVVIKG